MRCQSASLPGQLAWNIIIDVITMQQLGTQRMRCCYNRRFTVTAQQQSLRQTVGALAILDRVHSIVRLHQMTGRIASSTFQRLHTCRRPDANVTMYEVTQCHWGDGDGDDCLVSKCTWHPGMTFNFSSLSATRRHVLGLVAIKAASHGGMRTGVQLACLVQYMCRAVRTRTSPA